MKDILTSWRNLFRRLKGESPAFFKQVRNLMISIGLAGMAAYTSLSQFPNLFPAEGIIMKVCSYAIVSGVVGTVISMLTVKDNSQARP